MKIIKINSCMDCPKYVDDEVGWCEITRAVAPLEGLPMWCPLEEVHDTRTNEKCNLINEWKTELEKYSDLETGKYGYDEFSFRHGKREQLDACIDDLEDLLNENNQS